MPIFADMATQQIAGTNFSFSAKRIEDLGATEYTLVGIAADVSGSVAAFQQEIEDCIKQIVQSCKLSPRADNLMLRTITFDHALTEVHGFRPLAECNLDSYNGCTKAGGSTALYDASVNLIGSLSTYGKSLTASDFEVNGIVFVITDGEDNQSAMTVPELKKTLEGVIREESMESVVSVLIGVNISNPNMSRYLNDLKTQAGFTQYVELGNASAKTLAKLAEFVSKSISAQSQSLGTGGASQLISF